MFTTIILKLVNYISILTSFVFFDVVFLQISKTLRLKSSALALFVYRLSTFGIFISNFPTAMIFICDAEMISAKSLSMESVRVALC